MDKFQVGEEELLQFYQLKTINPTHSWVQDSSKLNNDETANNEIGMESSFDILKDFKYGNQISIDKESKAYLNNESLSYIKDPLNGQEMSKELQYLPHDSTRLKYLVNSKQFNVKAFLRDMHKQDSFNDLNNSLDKLDSDIQDQSIYLKQLVGKNFTKYVKIKNKLDQIYKEFDEKTNEKVQADFPKEKQINVESLNNKVDEVIRTTTFKLKPLMDNYQKILNYQTTKKFVEQNMLYFNLPKSLKKCLADNDFNQFMIQYSKGIAIYSGFNQSPNTSQSLIIKRIWSQVENLLTIYKDLIWNSLINSNFNVDQPQETILSLFSKLLNLENFISNNESENQVGDKNAASPSNENPILRWMTVKLNAFQNDLSELSSHMISKIIHSQKLILQNDTNQDNNQGSVELSYYLQINQLFHNITDIKDTEGLRSVADPNKINTISATNYLSLNSQSNYQGLTDSPIIIEMWLLILKYINDLWKICNQFIEFWEHIEKFLDGTYQNSIINEKRKESILIGNSNIIESYQKSLILKEEQINDIRSKGEGFIGLISQNLLSFFMSSQASLPSSLKKGHVREIAGGKKDTGSFLEYGFIPPNCNGLSCLRYLPKIVEPILRFSTELAQLNITPNGIDICRNTLSIIIDRCVGAISSTKLRDISNFYQLENWQVNETVTFSSKSQDNSKNLTFEYGVTQFPEIVTSFQEVSIKTTRDLLFAFEKLPVINGISVVSYPSKQLLTGIEIQQIISMEAVLEAILKNAAKDKDNPRNSHTILTLTNLQYIRECVFPNILQYFDDAFEWNLTSKNLELFSLLSKMESSIFGNYLSDLKINLRDTLEEKFHEINWPMYTSNSFRVGDYIIEALMILIVVHSECFRIGPQLIHKILIETQIFIARYLFESFKPYIGNLSNDGSLQVIVDLEFFQRVMGPLLEKDTEATLRACLQNCFQNDTSRLQKRIEEIEPIVSANLKRTAIQFAAFN
ncbi:sec5p [Saccharomyces arboricola H-6]|uniref:Exocyst complex component SEC5 n=1 Tax=Saccharomyces arboricola (strain H-6 / AS 2.3317 / CBS 10644) TaxID=1160507 RepID=J8Q408_SACAR|nr:sec5p [Saccharomyces arboricola H-6]